VIPALPAGLAEVVLVDGESSDGTVEVARALRPDIRLAIQEGKGKGDALRSGFAAATGDVIVMLDADGSANPAEIPAFVSALVAGADYAKGSRRRPGGGSADFTRLRRWGNAGLVAAVNALFGCAYTDLCYGYNAFWRSVLPVIDVDCDGFEVETLMNIRAHRAGLRICEVPSFEHQRLFGESKLSIPRDGARVMRTLLRERGVRRGARVRRMEPAVEPAE
jgi:glycosyltransferase involved in cell wall biosynthesis